MLTCRYALGLMIDLFIYLSTASSADSKQVHFSH